MSVKKRILFISALDFKDKSIAVIRKTPEAFYEAGWEVDYLVARDDSKKGNYSYEEEINPKGINVMRCYWKLQGLRNALPGTPGIVVNKLAAYQATFQLYSRAKKLVTENNYDIVYGYEMHGVLAVSRLRQKGLIDVRRIVNRFQGTWLYKYYKSGNKLKLLLNREAVYALRAPSALCIMTNDGTQGNRAMDKLGDLSAQEKFVFWPNGVDEQKLSLEKYEDLNATYKPNGEFVFLTVSRLESWKRLDRVIETFARSVQKAPRTPMKLVIVGEGSERANLEALANRMEVDEKIIFTGSVKRDDVSKYLNMSDAFISMYDLSNVGNPLLEAIRANKIIFTLNNGDTASWIQHKQNGFIYDISPNLAEEASKNFIEIVKDGELRNRIVLGVSKTAEEKLWTWKERFEAETKLVDEVAEKADTMH